MLIVAIRACGCVRCRTDEVTQADQTARLTHAKGDLMNSIVYNVGAVVSIVALLSFLGLR